MDPPHAPPISLTTPASWNGGRRKLSPAPFPAPAGAVGQLNRVRASALGELATGVTAWWGLWPAPCPWPLPRRARARDGRCVKLPSHRPMRGSIGQWEEGVCAVHLAVRHMRLWQ